MTAEIIYDLPSGDYFGLDAMNPSTLKHGLRSRKRLKRAIDGECQPDPKTVIVGNAAHCILAGEFESRYAVMPAYEKDDKNCTTKGKPSGSKNTKYYREKSEAWQVENESKEEITEVQLATAAKVARNVQMHAGLLIRESKQEVAVLGEIAGVLMKTRLDGLRLVQTPQNTFEPSAIVWDLKTTSDVSDEAFYRVFKRLNYGFSAAVHCELLRQNGITVDSYLIIAAEVQDDYDVRVLDVPLQMIDAKLPTVERVAAEYRQALEEDVWPGLGDDDLFVPNWDMIDDANLTFGE